MKILKNTAIFRKQRNYEVKTTINGLKKLQQKYLLYYVRNVTVHKSP